MKDTVKYGKMDRMIVSGKTVKGLVEAPAGKSHMIRLMAAATLCREQTVLRFSGTCDDIEAGLSVCRKLGAEIDRADNIMVIKGSQNPEAGILDCRESGLCLRLFAPIAARSELPSELHAAGSLLHRPAGMIEQGLKQLKVSVGTRNGYPPVRITGPVVPGTVAVDGTVSSQFLSGLLMALPLAEGNSLVRVENLKSRPYVEMSLQVLKTFGVKVENHGFSEFRIPGNQKYRSPGSLVVEGDWSGAANLLVAGAVAGMVTVKGLSRLSLQADKTLLEILLRSGARVKETEANVFQVTGGTLKAFTADLDHCPDLAPPLIPLALAANGTSVLRSAGRLRRKESDRAEALVTEYRKLGADISYLNDALYIKGPATLSGGVVESRSDHRMVMSLATAALLSREPVVIKGWQAVGKSYPRFPKDLDSLGMTVTFNNEKYK